MCSPKSGNKQYTSLSFNTIPIKCYQQKSAFELLNDRAEMHYNDGYTKKQKRDIYGYAWHCALLKINLRMRAGTASHHVQINFGGAPREIAPGFLIKGTSKILVDYNCYANCPKNLYKWSRVKGILKHQKAFFYILSCLCASDVPLKSPEERLHKLRLNKLKNSSMSF